MLPSLVDQIEDLLPQTQCTKCGYPACRPYAVAIANGLANYNQCPPGGQEGIVRLAKLLEKPVIALDITHGHERPRPVAVIEEAYCIGCTLCIQACPVDAILGAAKQMHTVLPELCTGCDLCVAPCPVDCITMVNVSADNTGWEAWTAMQAAQARKQYESRQTRLVREQQENEERLLAKANAKLLAVSAETPLSAEQAAEKERKRQIISAAIERAQQKKRASETPEN
ncbi:electron transport complex subunit RsxB [Undibacterium sp. Ren11W]|uniref:electron transport complex subunit RsxB n=1 Tax=Undibacterium sp. Ren11W TaxID=3413045 RepID=UPI003BF0936D